MALVEFRSAFDQCVETGLVRTDVSDGSGRYRLVALPPGRYTLTAELPGFATQELANLGIVTLEINIVEELGTFKAWVTATETEGISEGIGTVGDNHLILNFDRGLNSDFYFEGTFETLALGNIVTRIDGRFIFPDRADPLPVVFE